MTSLLTLLFACRSTPEISNEETINLNNQQIISEDGLTAKSPEDGELSKLTANPNEDGFELEGTIDLQRFNEYSGEYLDQFVSLDIEPGSTLWSDGDTLQLKLSAVLGEQSCFENADAWLDPSESSSITNNYSGTIEVAGLDEGSCQNTFGDNPGIIFNMAKLNN
jgi:hypothetical protein